MLTIGLFCMADIPARHATLIVRNALWNLYAASNKKQVKEKFVAIFNPTREDVRRFFCDTWKKKTESHILTPLETIAGDWMEQHPEYHTLLTDSEGALAQDYTPERAKPILSCIYRCTYRLVSRSPLTNHLASEKLQKTLLGNWDQSMRHNIASWNV